MKTAKLETPFGIATVTEIEACEPDFIDEGAILHHCENDQRVIKVGDPHFECQINGWESSLRSTGRGFTEMEAVASALALVGRLWSEKNANDLIAQ